MIGTHDQFQRAQEAYENRSEPCYSDDEASFVDYASSIERTACSALELVGRAERAWQAGQIEAAIGLLDEAAEHLREYEQ